jgi:tetratricopeptide (TPR) repeat protein
MGQRTAGAERARDAARAGAWQQAYELFARLDRAGLGPEDLDALADAAWWTCRLETRGRALLAQGRVQEGAGLLDEAMCSVVAGELQPLFTGWVYCHVIAACWELADLRRAGDWTDAAMRWCEQLSTASTPYQGLCRIHRVEIATLRGRWTEAEAEARRTCDELMAYEPHFAGEAFYAAGELHRRRGDLQAAEASFARAHELGAEPHPGLAPV